MRPKRQTPRIAHAAQPRKAVTCISHIHFVRQLDPTFAQFRPDRHAITSLLHARAISCAHPVRLASKAKSVQRGVTSSGLVIF